MPRDGTLAPSVPIGEIRQRTWRDGIYVYDHAQRHPNGTIKAIRWFPSITSIGTELMGTRGDMDVKGGGYHLHFPSSERRIALFHEMLDIIVESGDWRELLTAAAYRRQLSDVTSIPCVDRRMFCLASHADPAFTAEEWRQLAERMPPHVLVALIFHQKAVQA